MSDHLLPPPAPGCPPPYLPASDTRWRIKASTFIVLMPQPRSLRSRDGTHRSRALYWQCRVAERTWRRGDWTWWGWWVRLPTAKWREQDWRKKIEIKGNNKYKLQLFESNWFVIFSNAYCICTHDFKHRCLVIFLKIFKCKDPILHLQLAFGVLWHEKRMREKTRISYF